MELDAFVKANKLMETVVAATLENEETLEAFRLQFLGTKNVLKPMFGEMRNIPNERKKEFGQLLNQVKTAAEEKFYAAKNRIERAQLNQFEKIDMTASGEPIQWGSRHPIALVMEEMVSIFEKIGFTVAEEREIEDDWTNFTALGTPEDHPARDMQDTFYLKDSTSMVLRTHTSPVQIRTMLQGEPPIRIIAPGRVYRNETVSARSHCQFHQIEGLYVAENVSFADLRQTLYYFAKEMFGATKIRLRPSYFPFTEPSAEMDVYLGTETERDRKLTKGTGWLEVLGCGMVDPVVLENCNIDPEKYTGFAFGIGIERIYTTKIMRYFCLLILLFSLFLACTNSPDMSKEQQTPETAAKAFFEALSSATFEKAAALATEMTQKQIKYLRTDLSMAADEEYKELLASFKLDFKTIECAEQAGTMTCVLCCAKGGGEATVELMQKNEKWFVHTKLGDYEKE